MAYFVELELIVFVVEDCMSLLEMAVD